MRPGKLILQQKIDNRFLKRLTGDSVYVESAETWYQYLELSGAHLMVMINALVPQSDDGKTIGLSHYRLLSSLGYLHSLCLLNGSSSQFHHRHGTDRYKTCFKSSPPSQWDLIVGKLN